jgi:hypothetical protein
MLTVEVAANLRGPVVTVEGGWARTLEVRVSVALAVK